MNMGVFPSGQWGQTVNLLLSASVVRIHPRPPRKSTQKRWFLGAFLLLQPTLKPTFGAEARKKDTKAKRAPSPQSVPLPARAAVHTVASLQELWGLLQVLYAEKIGQDIPTDRRS